MSTDETYKMNTFKIMNLIGDAPKELLDSTETAVLMMMTLFGDSEGKNINPGNELISSETKFSDRIIRKKLNSLVKKKVLVKSSIRRQGSDDKDCYEINIPLLQKIILKKSR